MRILAIILLLTSSAFGQYVQAGFNAGATSVTPAVVNVSGMPSSETGALGTQSFSGVGNCATLSMCAYPVDPTLAANDIIVIYTYKSATANTADIPTMASFTGNPNTGYSATGDTWTHCGTDGNNSTNDTYIGCYYKHGAATGTSRVVLTWANANTQVAMGVYQTTNTTAIDVYNSNSATGTPTTWNTGSVTSNFANDLFIACAIGTSTRTNVGAFTAGTGQTNITWGLDINDRRDAGVCQTGVQTATGTLNPAITAAANNYVGLTVALKSGSSGTAPSGMYISRIYHVSSAGSATSPLTYSIAAAAGDLVAVTTSGNYTQTVTAISDGVNGSWKTCGPATAWGQATNGIATSAYFFANSGAGPLNISMTLSGANDTGPAVFYDIKGAATTQVCGWAISLTNNLSGAAATFTSTTGYVPSSSAGLVLASLGVETNTILGSLPGTQDCNTFGGQSLDGPSYPDQNNGCSHYYTSSNAPTNIVWRTLDSGTTLDATVARLLGFQAAGATVNPVMVKSAVNQATSSGTSIAVTSFVPAFAGDTILVWIVANGITTGTFSVSDPTNGSYTLIDGPTNHSPWRGASFYAKNIAATTITITGATGTTNTSRSIHIQEWHGVSTTSPLDQHSGFTAVTIVGGVATGAPVTTMSTNEGVGFMLACQGGCDSYQGTTGGPIQPWTQPALDDTFDDTMGFLATGAMGTFTPSVVDSGGSGAEMVETISVH